MSDKFKKALQKQKSAKIRNDLWATKSKRKDAKINLSARGADEVHKIDESRSRVFDKVIAHKKNEVWACDLLDLSNWKDENPVCPPCNGKSKKCRFLCVVIDVYSRYAWVKPIAGKSVKCFIPWLKWLIQTESTKRFGKPKKEYAVKNFNSDGEKAILGNDFQQFLEENDINHFVAYPDDHKRAQSIVERLNRTIRTLLNKHFTTNKGSKRWYDVLDSIINTYNNSVHSGIKEIPKQVYEMKEIPYFSRYTTLGIMPILKEGTLVRYRLRRTIFTKGTAPRWSRAVYKVVSLAPITINPSVKDRKKTGKVWERLYTKRKKPYTQQQNTMTLGKKYYIKNANVRNAKKLERTFRYNDLQVVNSKNWRLNKEKLEIGDGEELKEENKKDALKKLKAQRKVWKDLGNEDRDKAFEEYKNMAKKRPKRKVRKSKKPPQKAEPNARPLTLGKILEEDDEKIGEEEPKKSKPKILRRSNRKGRGKIDRL